MPVAGDSLGITVHALDSISFPGRLRNCIMNLIEDVK